MKRNLSTPRGVRAPLVRKPWFKRNFLFDKQAAAILHKLHRKILKYFHYISRQGIIIWIILLLKAGFLKFFYKTPSKELNKLWPSPTRILKKTTILFFAPNHHQFND